MSVILVGSALVAGEPKKVIFHFSLQSTEYAPRLTDTNPRVVIMRREFGANVQLWDVQGAEPNQRQVSLSLSLLSLSQ